MFEKNENKQNRGRRWLFKKLDTIVIVLTPIRSASNEVVPT